MAGSERRGGSARAIWAVFRRDVGCRRSIAQLRRRPFLPPSETLFLRITSDYPILAHTATSPAANPAAVTLVTEDGFPLAGTRWLAEGEYRGVVLIAPAMSVPHCFYRRFAEYLAAEGYDTLCWDWRGVGNSRRERSLRDSRLTMRNWGEQDLAAAIAWAGRRSPAGRIALVGHSFGGLALGMAPNAHLIDRAVLVGAQHGWLGHWPRRQQLPLSLLWNALVPTMATVLGRLPLSIARLGEDVPKGVAREWSQWSRRSAYLDTWTGHASLDIPMLAFSFEDDAFAPKAAVDALLREYSSAQIRHQHGQSDGLGHFGFFQSERALPLWAQVAAFLREST